MPLPGSSFTCFVSIFFSNWPPAMRAACMAKVCAISKYGFCSATRLSRCMYCCTGWLGVAFAFQLGLQRLHNLWRHRICCGVHMVSVSVLWGSPDNDAHPRKYSKSTANCSCLSILGNILTIGVSAAGPQGRQSDNLVRPILRDLPTIYLFAFV